MRTFIDNPSLAFPIASIFLIALLWVRRACGVWAGLWPIAASLSWLLYGGWEMSVPQNGENIRIDLLVLYPALGLVSLVAALILIATYVSPHGPDTQR